METTTTTATAAAEEVEDVSIGALNEEQIIMMQWSQGLSELRARTGIVEIPLQQVHKCNGICPKLVDGFMDDGTPCMKFEDSKCNKNGVSEDSAIYIAGYTPDDFDDNLISQRVLPESGRKSPILGGDEIVIKDELINIEFGYPMNNPVTFAFESLMGFTRKKLVGLIVATYARIYAEEEKSIRDKPIIPIDERVHLINHNETDGKYGIYGHDIDDLWLEGIQYHRVSRTVILGIGS